MKRVLIIQPTIPHYRVPFFNTLERLRPACWEFAVTFDRTELQAPRILQQPLRERGFCFPTVDVRHCSWTIGGRTLEYQTVWRQAGRFDLVIAEHALRDLAYVLCALHRLQGVSFAYWGHGRDRGIEHAQGMKRVAERLKLALARRVDGYFAYTRQVRVELVAQGLPPDRVFAIDNTIDINEQRRMLDAFGPRREAIRRELGVEKRDVLLFVGRFTPNKRVPFLIDAFQQLRRMRPQAHLFVVGGGPGEDRLQSLPGVTHFGLMQDPQELAPIYVASDLFVYPGAVGLGPLQALCYELPVVAIDSPTHMPEFEYLTTANSVQLPYGTTAGAYATAVDRLLDNEAQLTTLRAGVWPSIRHLTIDNMAANFVAGVNVLLGCAEDNGAAR